MAVDANDGRDARTAASPDRGSLRDLRPDRQPSAQCGYRCRRLHGLGVDRGRRVRSRRRVPPADRAGRDRRRVCKPRAPPGDRAGDRTFCRLALCTDHRRHGVCDFLFADPRAGPRRSAHSMFPIMAHRAASTCIAFRPIAGSSSAPSEGWKIKRRTLRPLDGTQPAREILRGALEP